MLDESRRSRPKIGSFELSLEAIFSRYRRGQFALCANRESDPSVYSLPQIVCRLKHACCGRYMAETVGCIVRIFPCLFVVAISGCTGATANLAESQACADEWFRAVEEQLSTGDGQGHGPDPGSLEWRSVVEFKLGIREDPAVPPEDSLQWCSYIDEQLNSPPNQ